jgi:2-succinyl-5-enolpyruvyl-6-hydroxy-3-cyclohexene-1-carboxylate synthase
MNPSTALATVLVDELVRGGVREAVLCPGSRNAPLSFALHDADRDGRLRLHVRIDERTAGFLALGLAKASGQPVAVVTTSGTAAVNLHPAVVEADYSRVRLVVLTADRPVEMRGTGANQTIDQVNLYGGSVRWFHELSADEGTSVAGWRGVVDRALAEGQTGPVHLNVALREPLVPDGTRPGRSRWTPRSTASTGWPPGLGLLRPRRRRPHRRGRRRPGAGRCPRARRGGRLATARGAVVRAPGRPERAGCLPAAARQPR